MDTNRPNLVTKNNIDDIIHSDEISNKFGVDNNLSTQGEYELSYLVNHNKIKNQSDNVDRVTEINNDSQQSNKSNKSNRSNRSNRSNKSHRSNKSTRSHRSSRSHRSAQSNKSNRSERSTRSNTKPILTEPYKREHDISQQIFNDINKNEPNNTTNITDKERIDLLYKIQSLQARGITLIKKYDINSSYEEMKFEYDRLLKNKELDNSVKIQEKMLMTFVSVAEFMNERYDPFDLKLTGWSESIHENLNEYKDIFAELHEKYKTKSKTPPEIRLLISIFGSAFMFHFSQTVLKLGVNNGSLGGLGGLASGLMGNMGNMGSAGSSGSNNNSTKSAASTGINIMQDILNKQHQQNNPSMNGPSNIEELLKGIESHNNI